MFLKLTFGLLLASAYSVVGKEESPRGQKYTNDTCVVNHGDGFHPDFYLSITYELQNVACEQRMSVLVNGTSPGPELRLPGGKTSWVRVCNDMDEYNTTMVRILLHTLKATSNTKSALAWSHPTYSTVQ